MTYDQWKATDPLDEFLGPSQAETQAEQTETRELWLAHLEAKYGRIVTNHDYPPIPIRSFDWSATLEDYDGAAGDPIGHGTTEDEAIRDLIDEIEWRQE